MDKTVNATENAKEAPLMLEDEVMAGNTPFDFVSPFGVGAGSEAFAWN